MLDDPWEYEIDCTPTTSSRDLVGENPKKISLGVNLETSWPPSVKLAVVFDPNQTLNDKEY